MHRAFAVGLLVVEAAAWVFFAAMVGLMLLGLRWGEVLGMVQGVWR